MPKAEALASIEKRLRSAGLGFDSLQVFGTLRINVHVVCRSRNTAEKWQNLLTASLGPCKVVAHRWEAKDQAGSTCLRPIMRNGWLIACIA